MIVRPGPFDGPWDDAPFCGDPREFVCGVSPSSMNPVDLSTGHKSEMAVDLTVPLCGIPFRLTRQYSSNPGYSIASVVGCGWTASFMRSISVAVSTLSSGKESVTCTSALLGGRPRGAIGSRWCSGEGACADGAFNASSGSRLSGDTDQILQKTYITVDSERIPVWRVTEPGQWMMDYYRSFDADDSDDGYEDSSPTIDPAANLRGKLLQVSDPYGNKQIYLYSAVVGYPINDVLPQSVFCYESAGALAARIEFSYDVGEGSGSTGRLLAAKVLRPYLGDAGDRDKDLEVQRVSYTYHNGSMGSHLGTVGDLIQVRVEERVDPAPGAESQDSVWHTRVTQYRYHTGVDEISDTYDDPSSTEYQPGDGDGDGYLETGGRSHQLKLIILPQQVEFYAQLKSVGTGSVAGYQVEDYAGDLLALKDGEQDEYAGNLSPIHLASKVVSQYEGSGSGRVLQQCLLVGCGCGAGGAQGLQEEFEYLASDNWKSTRLTQSYFDTQAQEWIAYRYRFADMERLGPEPCDGEVDSRGWYLVNDASAPAGETEPEYWVRHYEYTEDAACSLAIECWPSAMSEYAPANGTTQASYSASSDSGLVMAYAYDANGHRTERRVHQGMLAGGAASVSNYALLERTTWGGAGVPSHLVTRVDRVRLEGSTSMPSSSDDIETTTFAYGFFDTSSWPIAWKGTSMEAELPIENGPAASGTVANWYTSWSIFDSSGLAIWEVAPDGSYTRREFDSQVDFPVSVSRTGSVVRVVRNASPTEENFPSANIPTGLPTSRNSQGGSLEYLTLRDVLGRVQQTVTPGGATQTICRELRTSAERPGLLYLAETHLPHQWGTTKWSGVVNTDWIDAAGRNFESRGYKPGGQISYVDIEEQLPYRQIVDDYAVSTGSDDFLSRSCLVQHASGLVEEARVWHAPSESDGYYKTVFEYDPLGRQSEATGPTDAYGASGTRTRYEYDFLDRLKAVSTCSIGTSVWTLTERTYYDSHASGSSELEVPGDGRMTLKVNPIGASGDDRATRYSYDYRGRLISRFNPMAPHQLLRYDNLDRVTLQANLRADPVTTDFDTTSSVRATMSRTTYSQRGLVVREETAIDPSASIGSAEFLSTEWWFDQSGRPVEEWRANEIARKMTYDGLGRLAALYFTDRGSDPNPHVNSGYSSVTFDGSSDLTDDHVIAETCMRYISEDRPGKGLADLMVTRRRAAGSDSTGALADDPSAVASYMAAYYDGGERLDRLADFGTYQDCFRRQGSEPGVPDVDPDEPVSSSPNVRVSQLVHGARGLVDHVVLPDGTIRKYLYDGMGRRVTVIENAKSGTVIWDSALGRWKGSGLSANAGEDRATSVVLNARGDVVKYIAHIGNGGASDQVTTYEYGVTTALSEIASDSLLHAITLLHAGEGSSPEAGTVTFEYNSQGEVIAQTDQNGTVHRFQRDLLGRVAMDEVIAFGTGVDDSINRIAYHFDSTGNLGRVRSLSSECEAEYSFESPDSEASLSCVVNEVSFGYSSLQIVENIWQNSFGYVSTSGGAPSGTTRLVQYVYETAKVDSYGASNFNRIEAIHYPSHENTGSPDISELMYQYDDGVDDTISRPSGMELDGVGLVKYGFVGRDIVSLVDFSSSEVNDSVPDIQLDRTVSADGKRRYAGVTGDAEQDLGVYPGLDRFGRIAHQDWVDATFHRVQDPHSGFTYSGPNGPQVVSIEYAYDTMGNRISAVDARPNSSWINSFAYSYDGLQRLTAAERGEWSGTAIGAVKGKQGWSLDILGNWAQFSDDRNCNGTYGSAEIESRVHDALDNELSSIDRGAGGTDCSLSYDNAGNLESLVAGGAVTTYTHDAWGRLVRVVIDADGEGGAAPVTQLEQQFNGLGWRAWMKCNPVRWMCVEDCGTAYPTYAWDQPGLVETREYSYDASWRLLEERVDSDNADHDGAFDTTRRNQYVWGIQGVNDVLLHRSDVGNDGDFGDTADGTWYHLTDAMFSTVAIVNQSGTLVERTSYSAYGAPRLQRVGDADGDGATDGTDLGIVLGGYGSLGGSGDYHANSDFNRDGVIDGSDLGVMLGNWASPQPEGAISILQYPDLGGARGPDSVVGWCGYLHVGANLPDLLEVRYRAFSIGLGRWLERDPLEYVDGSNLYEYCAGRSVSVSDPMGLFLAWNHADITRKALRGVPLRKRCVDHMVAMNIDQDFGWLGNFGPASHDENHGDNSKLAETIDTMLARWREAAGKECRSCDDLDRVLTLAGRIMHALQDIYAHSNWVEKHGNVDVQEGPGMLPSDIPIMPMWSGPYGQVPEPESVPDDIYSGHWDPTGKTCAVPGMSHDEMNKDGPGSERGRLRGRNGGGSYYEKAADVASRHTREFWDRFWPSLRPSCRRMLDACCYGNWETGLESQPGKPKFGK